MNRLYLFGTVLLVGAFACETYPIHRTEQIPDYRIAVPPDLSLAGLDVAILSAAAGRTGPPEFSDGINDSEMLPASEAERLFGSSNPSSRHAEVFWKLTNRRPGEWYVEISKTRHSVRLRLFRDSGEVRVQVLYAVNLLHDNNRIHRRAITWIDGLVERVERNLAIRM